MKKIISRMAARLMIGTGLILGTVASLAVAQPALAQDRDQTRDCDLPEDKTCDQTRDRVEDQVNTTVDQDREKTRDRDQSASQDKDQDKDQDLDQLHDQDMERDQTKLQSHDSAGPTVPSASPSSGNKGGQGPH